MHIVYQSDCLNIHDYRFLAKLASSGHGVTLVTYRATGVPAAIASLSGLRILHRPLLRFEADWMTRAEGHSPRVVLTRRIGLLLAIVDFRAKLHSLHHDVIHAGMVQTSGLIAALSGSPRFLLMPWGSDILVAPARSLLHWSVTQYVLRKAPLITCDCEAVKQRIVQLTGYAAERIHVIPWGIDRSLFNPHAVGNGLRRKLGWDDKTILIMTRNFEPIYGHRHFLAALPEVVRAAPDVRVVLVGSGHLESELRLQVETLGLTGYVHFAGRVDNDKLPAYLVETDIYASTSLSDGTSLSLLEALACALPVVVTDVPANLEWVRHGENGFVVPRRDEQLLATRLIELQADRAMQNEMGNYNLALAQERADWDSNFTKVEALYEVLAHVPAC
jgi:glycosyltransferase involved in cell wall biosynthesis